MQMYVPPRWRRPALPGRVGDDRAGDGGGQGLRRGTARRVAEPHVRDDTALEERGDASLREVEELIDHDEVAGRD